MRTEIIILGIASLALMISPAVFGQDVEITIPEMAGKPGDMVTVPVNISDTTGLGIIAFQMTLEYDPLILRAMEVSLSGTIAGKWQFASNTTISGKIILAMMGMDPLSGSGPLVNIRFLVQPSARTGTTSQLHFAEVLVNGSDQHVVAHDSFFTVGDFPVGPRLAGDVNGDNRVNHLDLLKLVLTYNKSSGDDGYDRWADFNQDGRIDKDDMIILWENFGAVKEQN